MKRFLTICFLTSLLCSSLHADGEFEYYYTTYPDIPDSILANCTGILMLKVLTSSTVHLLGYESSQGGFQFADSIDIQMGTLPISHFGYPSMFGNIEKRQVVGTLRYPILNRQKEYVKILVDCSTNKTIWLRESDLVERYQSQYLMFNDMESYQGRSFEIDVLFNPSKSIKIYSSPSQSSEYQVISRDNFLSNYRSIHLKWQGGDFIYIYSQWHECGQNGPVVDIGWLPIHDSAGRLNFWIKNADNC